ncbi:hypothetical protein ACVWYF_000381 [Hymenobacter sp. UYAg731]
MFALQTCLFFLLTIFGLLAPAASGWAQAASGAATVAGSLLEATARAQYAAEDEMVRRGIVRRAPGEADSAFLKRIFPVSFAAERLVAYAWRPSAFGKQLFFPLLEVNEYRREGEDAALFVLDPFQPNTYAVQKLLLESIGDITNLSAFFFADVDRDGQKELLAVVYAEVQEVAILELGHGKTERAVGRMSHQHTYVFRCAGLSSAGRPRYRADIVSRPYLNELPTAAAVRRALAQHQAQR